MVLERNERAHHAWRAAGYAREPQWRRWTKPFDQAADLVQGGSSRGMAAETRAVRAVLADHGTEVTR